MSIEDFSQDSQVLLYRTDTPNESTILYRGVLRYIPCSNMREYLNIIIQEPEKEAVRAKGHYTNEIFAIPIIVKPK